MLIQKNISVLFNKVKKETFKAIKVYSLLEQQCLIQREPLVELLLSLFEKTIYELPQEFVIHGPYGIRKGGSVGIKAFKNKLEQKGHKKYHALDGSTENKLGFHISYNCSLQGRVYSELILWAKESLFSLKLEEVATKLNVFFPISCAYEVSIEDGINIISEKKLKRGLLGGMSLSISYEHINWILDFENGSFRKDFNKALLTSHQFKIFKQVDLGCTFSIHDNLHLVYQDI